MPYQFEVIGKNQESRWNILLANSLYPSYRQTFGMEYLGEDRGRTITTFMVTQNGDDIAGVHYSIKRSPLNILSTADILSGIVFKNQPTQGLINTIVNHSIEFAQKRRVAYIRINPWIPQLIDGKETEYKNLFNSILFNCGFNVIKEGRHTYWINLTHSEEELFKKMNSQTRRNINKAIKANFTVESYQKFSMEVSKLFYGLYKQLGEDKGFDTLSEHFFIKSIQALMENGATLFLIKCQGVVINIGLTTTFGIASYYHGALNPEYKNLEGCPAPGQYMQWLMITHLKEKGHKLFDMAFCPGPVPVSSHPNYNIWRFKYGFGGMHVQFLPTYGRALKPIRGFIFRKLRYR